MDYDIGVERREKYIRIEIGNGRGRSIDRTLAYIRRVREICREDFCKQYLLVDSGLMVHMSIAQLMGMVSHAVKILTGLRVAYVGEAVRQEDIVNRIFSQSVAQKLGLDCRIFHDETEAIAWLEGTLVENVS